MPIGPMVAVWTASMIGAFGAGCDDARGVLVEIEALESCLVVGASGGVVGALVGLAIVRDEADGSSNEVGVFSSV